MLKLYDFYALLLKIMPNLKHRQEKIQEKRKQTLFRDFVKEICSRFPVSVYRNQGVIARFPETDRCGDELYSATNYLQQFPEGPKGMDLDIKESFLQ